jgi:hypothetical protein
VRSKRSKRLRRLRRPPGRHPHESSCRVRRVVRWSADDALAMTVSTELRIGDVLVAEGKTSTEQRDRAVGVASRDGVRIGAVLGAAPLVALGVWAGLRGFISTGHASFLRQAGQVADGGAGLDGLAFAYPPIPTLLGGVRPGARRPGDGPGHDVPGGVPHPGLGVPAVAVHREPDPARRDQPGPARLSRRCAGQPDRGGADRRRRPAARPAAPRRGRALRGALPGRARRLRRPVWPCRLRRPVWPWTGAGSGAGLSPSRPGPRGTRRCRSRSAPRGSCRPRMSGRWTRHSRCCARWPACPCSATPGPRRRRPRPRW